MKKITTILLAGLATLFFTACGSSGGGGSTGGNTPAPSTTVNLVGTWKDTIATSGSICDGLIASSISVVEPYNGDPNVIGTITLSGTTFGFTSTGECQLVPLEKVDVSQVGTPSNMTENEYIEYGRVLLSGIGTIENFQIINYNTNIISIQVNLTNDVVMYLDSARQ